MMKASHDWTLRMAGTEANLGPLKSFWCTMRTLRGKRPESAGGSRRVKEGQGGSRRVKLCQGGSRSVKEGQGAYWSMPWKLPHCKFVYKATNERTIRLACAWTTCIHICLLLWQLCRPSWWSTKAGIPMEAWSDRADADQKKEGLRIKQTQAEEIFLDTSKPRHSLHLNRNWCNPNPRAHQQKHPHRPAMLSFLHSWSGP